MDGYAVASADFSPQFIYKLEEEHRRLRGFSIWNWERPEQDAYRLA